MDSPVQTVGNAPHVVGAAGGHEGNRVPIASPSRATTVQGGEADDDEEEVEYVFVSVDGAAPQNRLSGDVLFEVPRDSESSHTGPTRLCNIIPIIQTKDTHGRRIIPLTVPSPLLYACYRTCSPRNPLSLSAARRFGVPTTRR